MTKHYRHFWSFTDLLGKRTIIMGEVRSGKTRLAGLLLKEAVALGFAKEITIIDMAPKNVVIKGIRVGGKLASVATGIRGIKYLAPRRVETPRLSAKTSEELLHLVDKNRREIEPLLKEYISKPTPILFVNDISIYLQTGDFATISATFQAASTFVANGYYGKTLSNDLSTGISSREHALMDKLAAMMDIKANL